jgi:hypothetical protein
LDGVSVVGGVTVVVVVVSFAECDKSGDDVVAGRMSVVKGLVTEIVCKRVDTECGVVNKDESANSGVEESTSPIPPKQTSNGSRDKETHDEDDKSVVLVLRADERVRVEIGNVCAANTFGILLENHPAEMSVHQSFANRVGILLGIGISMMGTVIPRPPSDRAFNGTTSNRGKNVLKWSRSGIRTMSP